MSIDKWRGNEVFRFFHREVEERVGAATGFVRGEIIRSINRSQPTRSLSSGARVGLDPSREGEPPKRVEGDLVRSIVDEVISTKRTIRGRVGSTQTRKAIRLELGFAGTDSLGRVIDQGPRPFIRPPLFENRDKIKNIITTGRP